MENKQYTEIWQEHIIDQNWAQYSPEEHRRWDYLYQRQLNILENRATSEFIDGLAKLQLSKTGIPDFKILNKDLQALTGWQIVAVPGLIDDHAFFALLADRLFPAGAFIRRADQIDYIQEPDIFHDVFGHVPLLAHPVFADYMQAYGEGGVRANHLGVLPQLSRLYWYSVEFGLINTPKGKRIYGAGIVSSAAESIYCLEDDSPHHIGFDLIRLMRTDYRIDDFQHSYFVIDSFEQLLQATEQDFAPIYQTLADLDSLAPTSLLAEDHILQQGSQAYFNK